MSGSSPRSRWFVAGQRPRFDPAPELHGFPAEHGAVERLRAVYLTRVEPVEVQGSVFVDDSRALVLLCFPDAERRSLGIGEDGHAAGVHKTRRLPHDASAGSAHLGGGLVGAPDQDICVPHSRRRRRLRDRADGGNFAAVQPGDEVLALRARRHHVLELPAKQTGVEVQRRVGVRALASTQHGTPGMYPSRSGIGLLPSGRRQVRAP